MTSDSRTGLSLRGVLGEMWGAYRSHWRFLIPAAIVVLLPQSIVDGLLEDFHVDHIRTVGDIATIGAALLIAAVNLMGQVVYSGLTAAVVVDWRAGQPLPPLPALIRSMPIGRLIVLDLVVTLGVAIGFVLLIVPGLILLAYLAPSAPVMKLEHLGVRDAMRRSIELVRGYARKVFVIVVSVVLVTELAVELLAAPFDTVGVLVAINLLGEAIFQPFEGLVVALVAIHLLELHGQAPAPAEMARALVGEH